MQIRKKRVPLFSVVYGLISLAFIGCGVFCVCEARSYTDEQRARAPRLVRTYLACGVLLAIVGVGGVVWIGSGRSVWPIASLVAALPCLIQYRLHRTLTVDRSPLTDRLSQRIARKFNFPDR